MIAFFFSFRLEQKSHYLKWAYSWKENKNTNFQGTNFKQKLILIFPVSPVYVIHLCGFWDDWAGLCGAPLYPGAGLHFNFEK